MRELLTKSSTQYADDAQKHRRRPQRPIGGFRSIGLWHEALGAAEFMQSYPEIRNKLSTSSPRLNMLEERIDCIIRYKGGRAIAVNQISVLGFLIVATTLEATGDAVVRMGIVQNAWVIRCLLFLAGAVLLFGYGLSLNLAPTEFRRVIGIYVATLFVIWQIVNFVAFRSLPNASILVGGAFIVAGGAIVTFWE